MLLARYSLFYTYLLLVNTIQESIPKGFPSKKVSSCIRAILRAGKTAHAHVKRFIDDYGGFLSSLEKLMIKHKTQDSLQLLHPLVDRAVRAKHGFSANICVSDATAHENLQWYSVYLSGELYYHMKQFSEATSLFQACVQHNFHTVESYCMGGLSMISQVAPSFIYQQCCKLNKSNVFNGLY